MLHTMTVRTVAFTEIKERELCSVSTPSEVFRLRCSLDRVPWPGSAPGKAQQRRPPHEDSAPGLRVYTRSAGRGGDAGGAVAARAGAEGAGRTGGEHRGGSAGCPRLPRASASPQQGPVRTFFFYWDQWAVSWLLRGQAQGRGIRRKFEETRAKWDF